MYFVNHILEWIHLLLKNCKNAHSPRLMLVDVPMTSRKSVPAVRVQGPQGVSPARVAGDVGKACDWESAPRPARSSSTPALASVQTENP